MFESGFDFLIVMLGISALLLTLGLLSLLIRRQSAEPSAPTPNEAICIFRNGELIEANAEGVRLLSTRGDKKTNWRALRQLLQIRFPGFPVSQGVSSKQDITVLSSADPKDKTLVTIDQTQDTARVTVLTPANTASKAEGLENEISQDAPYPIWIIDDTAQVVWCNDAYRKLAGHSGALGADPIPVLFTHPNVAPEPCRVALTKPHEGRTLWFDVSSKTRGNRTVFFAVDANSAVRTETTQRGIVQSVSRTFAQLPTGLAVFDRGRNLIVFNPSLSSHTDLSATFLSSRPTIVAFFDSSREQRVAPEPHSSQTWYDFVSNLVHLVEDGRYCETWELPNGKSLRVTGLPQQDGAIALLIDDITAELALTRRFRNDLEIAHAALDCLDDPLALFAQNGTHLLCNASYRNLWKNDPDTAFAQYTMQDALTLWGTEFEKTQLWHDFRAAAGTDVPRQDWGGLLNHKSHGKLHTTLTPISGGATLVKFRQTSSQKTFNPA